MVHKLQEEISATAEELQQQEGDGGILHNVPVEIKQEEELIIEDVNGSHIRWCFIGSLDDDDEENDEFCTEFNANTALADSSNYGNQMVSSVASLCPFNSSGEDIIEITDDEGDGCEKSPNDDIYQRAINGGRIIEGNESGVEIVNEPIQEISFCHGAEEEHQATTDTDDKTNDDCQTEDEGTETMTTTTTDTNEILEKSTDTNSPFTRRHRRHQQGASRVSLNNSNVNSNEECLSVTVIKEMLARKYMQIKCHICKEIFVSKPYAWLYHLRDIHQDFYQKMLSVFSFQTDILASCKLCKLKINYKINHLFHYIQNHADDHTKPKIFLCSICDYKDASIFGLQNHQKEKHLAEQKIAHKEECPKCNEGFKNLTCLEFHFLSSHRREFWSKFRYNCHLCIKPSAVQSKFEGTRTTYYDHLVNEHKLDNWKTLKFRPFDNGIYWQCTQCFKLFMEADDFQKLLAHYLSHEENCFWSCKFCLSIHRFHDLPSMHICSAMKDFYKSKNREDDTSTTSAEDGNKVSTQKLISWSEFEFYVKHICPFCKDDFDKFDNWRQHIREKHHINTLEGLNMCPLPGDPDNLQCLECFAQVPKSPVELHKHRFQHLPFLPYKCRHCPKYLGTYKLALNHVLNSCDDEEKTVVSEATNVTNNANSNKSSKVVQLYNLKLDSSSTPQLESLIVIVCHLCKQKRFSNYEDAILHFRNVHNNFQQYFTKSSSEEGKCMCKICRKMVKCAAVTNIVPHYFTHLDEKPFKCRKCHHSFAQYKRVKDHVSSYHCSGLTHTEKNQRTSNRSEKHTQDKKTQQSHKNEEKQIFVEPKPLIKKESDKESELNCTKSEKELEKTGVSSPDMLMTKTDTMIKQENDDHDLLTEIIEKKSPTHKKDEVNFNAAVSFLDTSAKVFQEFCQFIKYACPECNAQYSRIEMWEQHIQNQHTFFQSDNIVVTDAKQNTKCRDCKAILSESLSKQRRHKLSHLLYQSFICSLCSVRCTQVDKMYQHLRTLHFEKNSRKCPMCPKIVHNSYELSVHLNASHARKEWPKDLCSICFNIVDDMESHRRKYHLTRSKTYCEICDIFLFKGKEQHMLTCHKKGPGSGLKAGNTHAKGNSAFKRKLMAATEANSSAKKKCMGKRPNNSRK